MHMQRRRDGGRHDALRGEAQRRRAAAEALRRAKKETPKDPPFVFLLLALFVLGAAARACYGARRALRAQIDAERGAPAEPCEAVLGDGVRGYVWVASAPPREGVNGWRPIVEAAAALARDLGYGLAVPCVRDSEVACCVGAGAALGCGAGAHGGAALGRGAGAHGGAAVGCGAGAHGGAAVGCGAPPSAIMIFTNSL